MDASYELQRAMYAALKNDSGVAALVGGRIYDRVPADVAFPYVSFGPEQEIPQANDCFSASELVLQLDVWSRDPGRAQAKIVARAVVDALTIDVLGLDENGLTYFEFGGRRILTDPDGLTTHAVLTFRAGIENV